RERGQQQQDAQVRIGSAYAACGLDALIDDVADAPLVSALEHRRDGGGAHEEVDVAQIVKIALAVHVAGLARGAFPDAGDLSPEAERLVHVPILSTRT